MLQYMLCHLCKGVYRDAHTINECMCTYCRCCIEQYYEGNNSRKCPKCSQELGGKPLESCVRDLTMQSLVDWLFPEFKAKEDSKLQKKPEKPVVV